NTGQRQLPCAGGGRPADRTHTCNSSDQSNGAGSRASIERTCGSGSEPTYLPLTKTSCAGLVLYFFVVASALDAVAMARAIASVVLANIDGSPSGWWVPPHPVCVHLARARRSRESSGGPAAEDHSRADQESVGEQTDLTTKGFSSLGAASSEDAWSW